MSPQELSDFDERMLKYIKKELLTACESGNRKYLAFLNYALKEWEQIIKQDKECTQLKDF